ELDRETINKILDAGHWAPSARNTQQWEFMVVQNKDKLKQIADITDYGKFIAEASACIIVYYEDAKYYMEDGCAAVENILLAAAALGLGACWVAGDKKPYCGQINELLNVPENYKLVALISLGVPADKPGSRRRKKSLEEITHWDKW
ncbi:nitroreductase family protein, partial [bacterium]|nr:nitroreductase family protein [bacterium]